MVKTKSKIEDEEVKIEIKGRLKKEGSPYMTIHLS